MEIARLVLEYLQVLAWPLVVLVLAWMFKGPLGNFLSRIRKLGFAGGTLDAEADEASNEANDISAKPATQGSAIEVETETLTPASAGNPGQGSERGERGPTGSIGHSSTGPAPASESAEGRGSKRSPKWKDAEGKNLPSAPVAESEPFLSDDNGMPDKNYWNHGDSEVDRIDQSDQLFENLRRIAIVDSSLAAREAYQRVRREAANALRSVEPGTTTPTSLTLEELAVSLANTQTVSLSVLEPSARLTRIYKSTKSSEDLSTAGALSFIEAAQKLEVAFRDAFLQGRRMRRKTMAKAASKIHDLATQKGVSTEEYAVDLGISKVHVKVFGSVQERVGIDILNGILDLANEMKFPVTATFGKYKIDLDF